MNHLLRKQPVIFRKLWVIHNGIAGTKFVSLCGKISDTIGVIVVDNTFEHKSIIISIGTLIIYLTRVELDGNKFILK